MPRYDDRYASTRLYVGHLASRTRSRDLEHIFSKYGRVQDVDMKRDYAFVEFSDPRDADDARYHLDGKDFDGSRIIVEFAKGVPRGSREYLGRGPPPGAGRCFNCGIDGHWARDCKAGDWKNKCYRCGDRGHIERNCKNSPKKLKRGRSYSRSPGGSRSPVRSRSPGRSHSPVRGRSRSPGYGRGRSYSRSRSPAPKRERNAHVDRPRSLSPEPKNGLPSKGRRRSLTPEDGSPRASSPKARKLDDRRDRGYSGSPRGRSPIPRGRSPSPRGRSLSPRGRSPSPVRRSPGDGRYESPPQANGRSPSPRERTPVPRDFEDSRRSPRVGSESPA